MNSLFEWFIKELNQKERDDLFAEDYYMPSEVELSRDISCSNPLMRCFESEVVKFGSLERILAYMFSRPFSKN